MKTSHNNLQSSIVTKRIADYLQDEIRRLGAVETQQTKDLIATKKHIEHLTQQLFKQQRRMK